MKVTFKGHNSKVVLQKFDCLEPKFALVVNGTVVNAFNTKEEGLRAFNDVITKLS